MNLRELTEDQTAILKMVENSELSEEDVKDHLEYLTEDRNKKIENYLYVLSGLELKAAAKHAEIKRIKELADLDERSIDRLKSWLLECMNDGEKHEFDLFKVTKVKGRQVVSVISAVDIPEKYRTIKQTETLDKRGILADLKNGAEIKGAELSTGKSSLRIK
ncbi:MAG: hypothetical protein GY920_21075 [Aliivibrio sp.]|nr:hypothetical protein [Aliivibrio sp.]MCP4323332.1 hypothetical protein [Alteromonadales bacterium]